MDTINPGQVGLSPERLKRIHAHMQSLVGQKKYAGILSVVERRGKLAYADCVGMLDPAANKPMQFDAIFRIASMTKPITSVAAMMLYEEGRFQMRDPVSKFIPEFKELKVLNRVTEQGMDVEPTEREMTIHDLLCHTSGFSGGFDPQNNPVDALYIKERVRDPNGTLKDMIAKLARLPLANHPGREWRYSLSTTVLGYLVQVISGMTFDVYLQKKIFEPLGMTDTGFHVPPEKHARLAAMHGPMDRNMENYTARFLQPATFFSGEGGLVSTAFDYLRFSRMLLNRGELDGARLLSRKTLELMTTNHLAPELLPYRLSGVAQYGLGFGLGFSVVMDIGQAAILGSVGTHGWGGLFNTIFWVDPKEELIGLLMTQYSVPQQPIRQEFRTLVYQAIDD